MKRFMLGVFMVLAVSVASCTTGPRLSADGTPETKRCSDTPANAVSAFIQGIRELSLALLRAVTPEGSSLYGIFGNNDEQRGERIIRQMVAHPEDPTEGGSCTCSVLGVTDTADPQVKIVVIKRATMVGDDFRDYKRSFRVRFEELGNCILNIDPIEQRWERIFS